MSDKFRARIACLCGLLMILSALLCAVAGTLWHMGTNAGFLYRGFTSYAPPDDTGLREDEYQPIAQMTADYLSGRADVFQYERDLPDNTVFPLFHSYEQAHMADCRVLFRLDRGIGLAAVAVFVAALLIALLLRQRRGTAKGMFCALALFMLLLTVLAIWGLINFDGLFITFHRLAFTNELWLLNPQTDLLVRLMPISFFYYCVQVLGLVLLGTLLLALTSALLLRRGSDRPKGVFTQT